MLFVIAIFILETSLLFCSYLWQIPLTIVVGNRSHMSPEAIIWVSNKSGKIYILPKKLFGFRTIWLKYNNLTSGFSYYKNMNKNRLE